MSALAPYFIVLKAIVFFVSARNGATVDPQAERKMKYTAPTRHNPAHR